MLATADTSLETLERAIYLIATSGVEVVRGAAVPMLSARPDHPVLYLLEPDQAPPRLWSGLEDWVRLPADPAEVHQRADRLLARADETGACWVRVDDDDVLCAGRMRAPLSPMNAALVRLLLERSGTIVSRHDIEQALWPAGPPDGARALDNVVRHLRQRLVGLPVEIHTARSRGFVLQRATESDRSLAG